MKRIESACLQQTLIFDSCDELEAYKKQLEKKRVPFKVESVEETPDHMVTAKVLRRHIHYPVGDYLD